MALFKRFFQVGGGNASSKTRGTPILRARCAAARRASRGRRWAARAMWASWPRALTWGRGRDGGGGERPDVAAILHCASAADAGDALTAAALAEAVYSQTDEGIKRVVAVRLEQWEGLANPVHSMQVSIESAKAAPQKCLLALGGGADKGGLVLFAAFMGTKKTMDILADADARAVAFPLEELPQAVADRAGGGATLAAHAGFLRRARSMPMQLLLDTATAVGAARIVLCGHSLGGAVSTLATLRLMATAERGSAAERKLSLRCFAFGAPACCGGEIGRRVTAAPGLANKFSNYCTPADIVPYLLSVSLAAAPPQRNEGTSRKRAFWRLPRLAKMQPAAPAEEIGQSEEKHQRAARGGRVDNVGVSLGLPIFAHFGQQLSIGRSGVAQRSSAEEREGKAALATRRAGRAAASSLFGAFTSHRMPTYQGSLAHVCRDALARARSKPRGMHLLAGKCGFGTVALEPAIEHAVALAALPRVPSDGGNTERHMHVALHSKIDIAPYLRVRLFQGGESMPEVAAGPALRGDASTDAWQVLSLPFGSSSALSAQTRGVGAAAARVELGWRTPFVRHLRTVTVVPRRVCLAGFAQDVRDDIASALEAASAGGIEIVSEAEVGEQRAAGSGHAVELVVRAGESERESVPEGEIRVSPTVDSRVACARTFAALEANAPRAAVAAASRLTDQTSGLSAVGTMLQRVRSAFSWLTGWGHS